MRLSFVTFLSRLTALAVSALLLSSLFISSAQKAAEEAPGFTPNNLHQWGAVTLFHGLPSDRVRAIAQTPDGAMWFGTDAGLARYDGRRTQAMVAEGLKQGRVLALRVDSAGTLWVGTEEGAAVFTGTSLRLIKETEGRTVTAIIHPEPGRAVLATNEGLVFDCRSQQDGSLAVKTMPNEPLQSADENRRGPLELTSLASAGEEILAGTHTRGLLTINAEGARSLESRPRAFFVEALERDAQGTLWMGARAKATESGLYQARDGLHALRVGESLGTVTALASDGAGGVWAGTDGQGVYHYQPNLSASRERFTFDNTSGGLRSNSIYAIFIDREGVIWFGTDKGVCRYDRMALRVETISEERASNFVRTLFQPDDGRVFAGTSRGLFIADAAGTGWGLVNNLSHQAVYAIDESADGRLLVGTSVGLYISNAAVRDVRADTAFTPVEGESIEGSSTDSVRSVVRFRGRSYAASFRRGVERVDDNRRTLLWPATGSAQGAREVVSLYADGDAWLWIGTAGGDVLRYDGERVVPVAGLEALKSAAVWQIQRAGDDFFWIASAKGLYALREGKLVNIVSGLDVRRVLPDSNEAGAVWCATSGGGLMKALITESFGAVVSRQDVEQGLPSQNAFALLASSWKYGTRGLLVGTSRGLARYEPGQVQPVLAPTRIISRRVHQPEELRAGLRLEYPQNSLVLDVQAIGSRTFPEQFQYGFMLFDEAGRLVKQKLSRDAQLMMEGLRPGRYRVEARAYNADLIPSEPLRFEFSVAGAPFPWTTSALAVLLLLALIALYWGYFQNRRMARTSRDLLEANRNLADARLQVANQAERERRRIARDLHDQTLADLRNLILLTDQLPAKEAENGHARLDPGTFRSEIEAISTEIRRICEDLSPSALENVGLSAALEWALSNSVAHAPAECRFEYEFRCPEDLEEQISLAPGERMQIYRIAQEAINNICRHSGAKHVRLEVKIGEEKDFLLELEDDGRDFDPKENKRKRSGRGLSNILARASLLEAEVSWRKRRAGGTVFTLHKPGQHESVEIN
ncbi:MAG TPA: two-component regulator propeller domain-containing protein [Pyrinomonadaceae bacterium]|nr:two-component regulator propeller domain-containing protein [Pyrinomonadaceae bacterium]